MNNQAAQTMPELPEPAMPASSGGVEGNWEGDTYPDLYAADQMHQYARDYAAALSQTAGVAEPNGKLVGWWNGIMPDVTERSPYWPSVRWGADAEDSAHDIPLYDGYNPIHYRHPDTIAAAPAASGGDNCEECQIHRQAHHKIDSVVMGAGVFEVLHEGGVEPAWKNTIEAVNKLANPLPAEPVSERARELLADAFRDHGYPRAAESLEAGFTDSLDECALAAIEQALTQQRGECVAEIVDNPRPEGMRANEYWPSLDIAWKQSWMTFPIGTKLYTTPQPSADAVREDGNG